MQNDFFYFSRGQRKAVIVLIALIVVLTGLLFWKDKYIQSSKPEEILIYKQETESFLQQLKTDKKQNTNLFTEKETGYTNNKKSETKDNFPERYDVSNRICTPPKKIKYTREWSGFK